MLRIGTAVAMYSSIQTSKGALVVRLARLYDGVTAAAACAVLAAALILLPPMPANSQTLLQALTQTYRTNPQIDAARATLRATDEDVARANATFRPSLNANALTGWTRTDITPPTSQNGEFHPKQFGVTFSQPLFRGLQSLNQLRGAEASVRAGRETLRNTEQTVLLLAATAYVDVLRDQALLRLRENNVKVLSNQLQSVQIQFQVGEGTRTDVAQAEAGRAGAIADLEVARGNLRNSQAIYERIVGSPPGSLTDAREPVRLMPKSLAEAEAIAQRENPLIQNALYLEQAARHQVEQIRGELMPQVTLNASYTKGFDTSRTIDEIDTRTVTTNMTMPLYSNGGIEARIRQAKHTHVARIQTINQIRAEQLALVVAAWARYNSAKAQGISTGLQIKANQSALAGVREEYRVGQRTLLDVLNAEQALLNSRLLELTAKRDATVQAYTLLQTIGRLSAAEMGLGEETYDPEIHYFEVRRKWFGLAITHADGRREKVDASADPVGARRSR